MKLPFAALVLLAAVPAHGATMAYWEDLSSNPSLNAEIGAIRELATDTFDVDAKGNVTGTAPVNALALAAKHGAETFATISNFGATDFDPAIADAILNGKPAQATMFAGMNALVAKYGYSGINIDFEAIPPGDRPQFSAFVAAAASRLHAAHRLLAVSVPAVTEDDPNDSWAGAYNLAVLGKSVDILQYMTYDENGPWGPTGPVAGLDWVKACATYAAKVVPKAKISLGVPAYGYDWDLTAGTGVQVPWKQIPALISRTKATPQWDKATSSPWFTYVAGGHEHTVWYENGTSIKLKAQLATTMKLGGVSMFALGYDSASFWTALAAGGQ